MTEQLVDVAARGLGVDPLELRRRNYLRGDRLPGATLSGMAIEQISLDACLDRLAEAMDYEGLRAEQVRLRGAGTHRGIGVATFLEQTSPGPRLYGPAGVPATAQDSCSLRFEPSGVVRGTVGATDQGQGTLAGITQIVAAAIGLPFDQVVISAGDSAGAQGGGAWASRGLAIGGEAAFAAARELRDRLLAVAAPLLQADPGALDIRGGEIVAAGEGTPRMSVAEVTKTAYFRQDQLPPDLQPELSVTRSFVLRDRPHLMANGVQASHLEVDIETGEIRLLGHWVVEDCGRVVNPLLVDEQIRGGVVIGLGAALFEHIVYDENAQLLNATLADYLLPTAAEMPDIVVEHIETRQSGTALGVKGAGEAGTIGAAAAVWCAVNDALAHFGAHVSEQPVTPEVVLRALGRI
jgi:carbon-monoxide dehydrogenase large subunit